MEAKKCKEVKRVEEGIQQKLSSSSRVLESTRIITFRLKQPMNGKLGVEV